MLEDKNSRQLLIKIADDLLVTGFKSNKYSYLHLSKLAEEVEKAFQDELRRFFLKSNYYSEIENLKRTKNANLDEKATHLLAAMTEGENVPQIARQLPKFNNNYKNAGYECTFATAILRLAFEQLRLSSRSLLLRRHFIAARFLGNGKLKLYDAATRNTQNNKLHGFIGQFDTSEIIDKQHIRVDNKKSGFVFTIQTKKEVKNTNLFIKDAFGNYRKKSFAYHKEILIPLSVVLENLEQFKKQKDKDSIKLCEKNPYLQKLDYRKMKRDLNLFDGYDYLQTQ